MAGFANPGPKRAAVPPRSAPTRTPTPGIGEKAADQPGVSGDSGTTQSSDWLAERQHQAPPPEPATPMGTSEKQAQNRGRAKESRRGSF